MAWILLVIAGLLEVGWAIGLKYTEGFTRPFPTVLTLVSMVASMGLLGLAAKTLPIGTAYGVWVGIGAVGAAILGIVLFKEPATPARLVFLGMMIVAIIGLKATSGH
ncbi:MULTISPECIES: quaternary ammonium compound efflux SMR transporter SugE [Deinococcus]|uniref:SugE family protein n=1 Tax=Deinococcus geothermalis (strain DSM 11300 / CIP 105573 / AG-3a) TaxID=319795 RepID=Q1IWC0_DEIGD|nr:MULTISPECIES: quaternary ammonium compound efflux SMR transporter SugE [Deinococcus]ABF46464.1 SugE family protein [Deinococcus geothermalis DSM 11300]MBI0444981.1 quaternary ammonium compound efflux SMR transporter SugE [Deinococcus sp. DB0503]TDE86857.1 quaternary ammonium compound efflux SMR transporter SugE [Deinococcus sp. S9]